jgi:hypothetical protein
LIFPSSVAAFLTEYDLKKPGIDTTNAKIGYRKAFLALRKIKINNINKLKIKIGQNASPKYEVKTNLFGEISGFMTHKIMLNSPKTAKTLMKNISKRLPNELFFSWSSISFSCFV